MPAKTFLVGAFMQSTVRSTERCCFWSRPPYAGGYWVAPRYCEHRYYPGYWERRNWRWDRDDDERWEHHDRGLHRGWYRHHHDDDEQ
jgi:hypothetical protein